MTLGLPETDGFALDFGRTEYTIAGKIYNRLENVSMSQPVEEGAIMGSHGEVIARTRGQKGLGEASLEFTDSEEAFLLITDFGPGWAEKLFTASWTARKDDNTTYKVELFGCRLLDFEADWSQGPDGLPATLPMSFMRRLINGLPDFIAQ